MGLTSVKLWYYVSSIALFPTCFYGFLSCLPSSFIRGHRRQVSGSCCVKKPVSIFRARWYVISFEFLC